MLSKEEKLKRLAAETEKINKEIGTGTVISLSDHPDPVQVISTGSLGLDLALGVGGLPRGRIVEIYGPESSGKTTIATHVMAEAQKKGGLCAMIDAEHAFDPGYAEHIGVSVSELRVCQPSCGEEALEVLDRLLDTGALDVIVIDSVAALVPKAELEGQMGESKMGLHARLMSQALRKIVGKVSKSGTIVIFINQLRDKIGVMFGNPETTTGGNGLRFYASVRLDVRRSAINKEGDAAVSNRVKVKIIKNKVAPPFKVVEFDIVYGEGIDKVDELVSLGVELKLIAKGGAWLTYKDLKVQGKESLKQILRDNDELAVELEAEIKQAISKL